MLIFMLGGSAPAVLARHGSKYDMVLLAMDLPDGRTIKLRRPRRGAGFLMFEGAPQDGVFDGQDGIALSPKHGAAKDDSVSPVLLRAIGIEDAFIASTQVGEKLPGRPARFDQQSITRFRTEYIYGDALMRHFGVSNSNAIRRRLAEQNATPAFPNVRRDLMYRRAGLPSTLE